MNPLAAAGRGWAQRYLACRTARLMRVTVPNPMLPVDKSDVFEERAAAHHLANPVLGPRGVTDG